MRAAGISNWSGVAALRYTKEVVMRIIPVGHALSLFLVITFGLCVLWGLVTPTNLHMHGAWEMMMPGFHWLSLPAFIIGAVWAYLYGWYTALVFVPLYNFFNRSKAAVANG